MRKLPATLLFSLALAPLSVLAQGDTPATVVDLAAADAEFSTLVAAIETAGLADTLGSTGPFTVFAPTNAAFEAALAELGITADELLARDDLADILTYHVVPSQVLAADVLEAVEAGGGEFTVVTVNGAELTVTVVDGQVTLNDSATVTATDLLAGNGVVHVIDAVLLPPAE